MPGDQELLPCPFCGGKAEVVEIDDGENAGGSCVSCTRCQASSNVEFEFKENFVSNWNRRAAPEPVKNSPENEHVRPDLLSEAGLRGAVARTCCYWADPVKNGTCHDNYCVGRCSAVQPEKQFFDMADHVLALPQLAGLVERVRVMRGLMQDALDAPHAADCRECAVLASSSDPASLREAFVAALKDEDHG